MLESDPIFTSHRSATMFDPKLLSGQRILVTGGGTGLGQAMAERFLGLGADVAICGRRKSVCDATAEAWRKQFPERRIDTFGVDIRDAGAVEEMVEALWQQGGGLTGLVNNAAGNFVAPTESLSSRAFDAVANIVFHGTFYVTQAVGKRWVAGAKAGEWTPETKPYRSVMSIIVTWVERTRRSADESRRATGSIAASSQRPRPPSRRAGRNRTARRNANSASKATPISRTGRLSNHSSGHATSAASASGQHRTKSTHHTTSANRSFIASPPQLVRKVPVPPSTTPSSSGSTIQSST